MLTLDYVKEFLRIDHDSEDGYLSVLILLAKELCENYLRHELPDERKEPIEQAQLLQAFGRIQKRGVLIELF